MDADSDGYGDSAEVIVTDCEGEDGYVIYDGDCDDDDFFVRPAIGERCNEIDDDCDGEIDEDCTPDSAVVDAADSAACEDTSAEFTVEGDQLGFGFNVGGTWNNSAGDGIRIAHGSDGLIEGAYYGSPWQFLGFRACTSAEDGEDGETCTNYTGNYTDTAWSWDVDCGNAFEGEHDVIGSVHTLTTDDFVVRKTVAWLVTGAVARIWFEVLNTGGSDLSSFTTMHAVDMDHDIEIGGSYSTWNDTHDDGLYAESLADSDYTAVGYGACDSGDELGHTDWSTDILAELRDDDGEADDDTIHWRHTEGTIATGETAAFGFLVVTGPDSETARAIYDEYAPTMCVAAE
jgi:hypothetical protein